MDEAEFEELDNDDPKNAYKICKAPDSNGVLVAHENCNEFHKCTYGKAVVLKCAPDLLFNTMTQKCDRSHNVDCGNRLDGVRKSQRSISKTNRNAAFLDITEEISRSNFDPGQAHAICAARYSDGVLVAHKYCGMYYKCFAGVPNTMKCPMNLLYNPVKVHCDWPRNVDCDGRAIIVNDGTEDTENSESKENNVISEKDDDTTLSKANIACADEANTGASVAHKVCSHFYKCVDKKPVAYGCPGDLLYNAQKNYCDWPRNVNCGDRTIPGLTLKRHIQDNDTGDLRAAITICASEGSDGLMLSHTDCSQYYECYDRHPVIIGCAPHLLYNPETERCDWPTYVSCAGREIPVEFVSMTLDTIESH